MNEHRGVLSLLAIKPGDRPTFVTAQAFELPHSPAHDHLGPWRGRDDVEQATLEWVQWYNDTRLHGELGYLSPTGYEEQYALKQNESAVAA